MKKGCTPLEVAAPWSKRLAPKARARLLTGFTTIETLLFVATSGTILLATSLFLVLLLQSRVKNQTVAEVEQNGAQMIQIMSHTIRSATAFNTPSLGTTDTSASFAILTPIQSPTVFDMSGTTLRMTEGTQQPITLSSPRVNVSNLSFANLGTVNTPGSIRIQFTLTHMNTSGKNEYDYVKTFYATASLRR